MSANTPLSGSIISTVVGLRWVPDTKTNRLNGRGLNGSFGFELLWWEEPEGTGAV
jgi:hypothetical protein